MRTKLTVTRYDKYTIDVEYKNYIFYLRARSHTPKNNSNPGLTWRNDFLAPIKDANDFLIGLQATTQFAIIIKSQGWRWSWASVNKTGTPFEKVIDKYKENK